MKKQRLNKFFIFIFFPLLLIDCSACESDDDDGVIETYDDNYEIRESYLSASINDACSTTINYEANDVYSIPDYEEFIGDFYRLGGHPTNTSELPDIGINLFYTEAFVGTYPVSDTWDPGVAFIYYIDENGNEYNSTTANTGAVVTVLEDGNDFLGSFYIITFENVEVYCDALNDTKCIGTFTFGNYIF